MLNRERLLALNYVILLLGLVVYVYLGMYRALPYNILSPGARTHSGGATTGSIEKIYNYAKRVHNSSEESALDIPKHILHRGHNPGFFRLVSVWLYEAGVRSLFGLQMLPLALSTSAILVLYLLAAAFFGDRWIALFAALFAAFSPTFLTQATSLGGSAYGKLFQLMTLLAFLQYLRGSCRLWLIVAFGSYFLACWNYWHWHVGTAVLLIGLHYVHRRSFFH